MKTQADEGEWASNICFKKGVKHKRMYISLTIGLLAKLLKQTLDLN